MLAHDLQKLNQSKKNFCFVLPNIFTEHIGGSERQAYLMADELIKRSWEIHYIRENNDKIGCDEHLGQINLHAIPQRHTKLKWLNIPWLYRIMRKIRSDVWYCRGTRSYFFSVWLLSRLLGGKAVWACSSDSQVSKTMKKSKGTSSLVYNFFYQIDKCLFLYALKKADLILLQNSYQKTTLKQTWGLSGEIIYNGVNLSQINKIGPKEPLILWIGRLQPLKHPEKFLAIVKKLRKSPVKFFIIGRIMGYTEFLCMFENEERINPNFKYIGELEHKEMLSYLSRARLIVNTSDFEGFSNTFIEAWAHGVPIVSLSVDPDHLIQTEKLGRLSRTLEQLAIDIYNLASNDEKWKQLSKNARSIATNKFDIRNNVSRLENIIGSKK